MRAGALRHRVRIDALTQGVDELGGMTSSWTTYALAVPAEIVPLSGNEFVAASGQQAQVNTRITVRTGLAITPQMRIVNTHDGDRIYEIRAVLPDRTNARHLTIMCETGVTRG